MNLSETQERLKNKYIEKLAANQLSSGEFKTYARTQKGETFYIGQSPFVTAHIAYLLYNINNEQCVEITRKSIMFLEGIDSSGIRVYKYWYGNTQGTQYPDLPYDMDDTAVVNTVLYLTGRSYVDVSIVSANINPDGYYYTWLRPSVKSIILNMKNLTLYINQLRHLKIFNNNNPAGTMAKYSDTELIVRLNVYQFMSLANKNKISIADTFFPQTFREVENELKESLHYIHPSVYYYTFGKFQKQTNYFKPETLDVFVENIKKCIKAEEVKKDFSLADITALYLSLSLLGRLTKEDAHKFISFINIKKCSDSEFCFCVGNKNYENYHTYFSTDFFYAMLVNLLFEMENVL